MMWINFLLIALRMGGTDPMAKNFEYWNMVAQIRAQGCQVYEYIYESCPGQWAMGAIPIPPTAVAYYPPNHHPVVTHGQRQ